MVRATAELVPLRSPQPPQTCRAQHSRSAPISTDQRRRPRECPHKPLQRSIYQRTPQAAPAYQFVGDIARRSPTPCLMHCAARRKGSTSTGMAACRGERDRAIEGVTELADGIFSSRTRAAALIQSRPLLTPAQAAVAWSNNATDSDETDWGKGRGRPLDGGSSRSHSSAEVVETLERTPQDFATLAPSGACHCARGWTRFSATKHHRSAPMTPQDRRPAHRGMLDAAETSAVQGGAATASDQLAAFARERLPAYNPAISQSAERPDQPQPGLVTARGAARYGERAVRQSARTRL